jgi:hypothetical protein
MVNSILIETIIRSFQFNDILVTGCRPIFSKLTKELLIKKTFLAQTRGANEADE